MAFQHAITDSIGKPAAPPDYRMAELPIWSTWAKFNASINESALLQYAISVVDNGYLNSQIEIDDMWQVCYGSSLTVDKKKLPDMKALVDRLHSMGFRVTVWVHTCVNVGCQSFFDEDTKRKFLVRGTGGGVGVVSEWWNGQAGYIDFSNPEAVDWYQIWRLQKLLDETGIDSYKFDSGENSYPACMPCWMTIRKAF